VIQNMLNVAANDSPGCAFDRMSPGSLQVGPTNLEIARSIPLKPIAEIAAGATRCDAVTLRLRPFTSTTDSLVR
jgi:hypothetical protein